jgi:hypothetical protein
MKKTTTSLLLNVFPLFLLIALQTSAFAQLNTSEVIGVGRSIFNGKNKKKDKEVVEPGIDVDAYLKDASINGREISILRIPEEKITSAAKRYIMKVQQRLEENYRHYRNNEHIEDFSYNIQNDIYDLKSFDANWPITYYEIELREYKDYDQRLTQTEGRIKDSTEKTDRLAQELLRDSIREANKIKADSIAYAKQVADFHFVNKPFTELKVKADAKSATMAKLNGGTYVTVWEIDEKTGYANVSMLDMQGYVLYAHLVEYLEELDFPNADIELYKKERYYSYTRNDAYFEKLYKAQEAKEMRAAAVEERQERQQSRSSGRVYQTGPRGGCYYINSNGNKTYVDRSLCR